MAMPTTNKTIETKGLVSFTNLHIEAKTKQGMQWVKVPNYRTGFAPQVIGDSTTKIVLESIVNASEAASVTELPMGVSITRAELLELLDSTLNDTMFITIGHIAQGNANESNVANKMKELFGDSAVTSSKPTVTKPVQSLAFLIDDDEI